MFSTFAVPYSRHKNTCVNGSNHESNVYGGVKCLLKSNVSSGVRTPCPWMYHTVFENFQESYVSMIETPRSSRLELCHRLIVAFRSGKIANREKRENESKREKSKVQQNKPKPKV